MAPGSNLSTLARVFADALTLMVGFVIMKFIGNPQGYWILLTIVFVSLPHYAATQTPLMQRVEDTVMGMSQGVVPTRLFDTVVGCCIAAGAAWLLLPHWPARQWPQLAAQALRTQVMYLRELLANTKAASVTIWPTGWPVPVKPRWQVKPPVTSSSQPVTHRPCIKQLDSDPVASGGQGACTIAAPDTAEGGAGRRRGCGTQCKCLWRQAVASWQCRHVLDASSACPSSMPYLPLRPHHRPNHPLQV